METGLAFVALQSYSLREFPPAYGIDFGVQNALRRFDNRVRWRRIAEPSEALKCPTSTAMSQFTAIEEA